MILFPDKFYYCCWPLPENKNSDEKMLCNENVYLPEDQTLCMGIHKNGDDLIYMHTHGWIYQDSARAARP